MVPLHFVKHFVIKDFIEFVCSDFVFFLRINIFNRWKSLFILEISVQIYISVSVLIALVISGNKCNIVLIVSFKDSEYPAFY